MRRCRQLAEKMFGGYNPGCRGIEADRVQTWADATASGGRSKLKQAIVDAPRMPDSER